MTTSRITAAFLGAQHPHVFPRLDVALSRTDVDVLGLFDNNPSTRSQLAERIRVKVVSDPTEILDKRPDLAIIDGFDHENPAYVAQAVDHCRALLIEKPAAPNLTAMEQLVHRVKDSGVHAQVGYMYHYSPAVTHARTILESGVLGALTLARFHAAAPVGCGAEIWQSLPQDMGGAFFTDGCHMLDHVVHLIGEPTRVTGKVLMIKTGPETEADIFKSNLFGGLGGSSTLRLGSLMHEDAAVAMFEYPTMLATFDFTSWEAHNWVEAWNMTFYGTNGTLEVGLVPPSYNLWVRKPSAGYERGWHSWRGTGSAVGPGASLLADENYQAELDDIISHLKHNHAPDWTRLDEALAVVRVADAVYRSAAEAENAPTV